MGAFACLPGGPHKEEMKSFTKRNILIYFRDIRAVLLSLLGVLIVVALYALFLADNLVQSFAQMEDAGLMVTSWLVAGLCAITPVSTSLGAMGALIADRVAGIDRDFLSSPIKRYKLVLGYLVNGLTAGLMLSFVILCLGGVWLWAAGAAWPGIGSIAAIAGVQLLAVLAGGSISFFLVTFFHTNAAFMAVSTVMGTFLGFLTGIYLPLGYLPEAMQWVVKVFPTSHAALLLRYLFLQGPGAASFAGVPEEVTREVWSFLGVRFVYNNNEFPLWGSVLILLATAAGFIGLSVLNYVRSSKR